MKKFLFIFALMTASLFSVAEASQSKEALAAGYHSSQSKGVAGTAYPTDIYVYNYLLNPYEFVIVSTPEAPLSDAKIYPYPYSPYFHRVWHTDFQLYMRIVIFDRFGYIFFDKRVEPHAIINVTPSLAKDGKPVVSVI